MGEQRQEVSPLQGSDGRESRAVAAPKRSQRCLGKGAGGGRPESDEVIKVLWLIIGVWRFSKTRRLCGNRKVCGPCGMVDRSVRVGVSDAATSCDPCLASARHRPAERRQSLACPLRAPLPCRRRPNRNPS